MIANKETHLYKSFMKRWTWLEGLWIEDVDKGGKRLPKGTGLYVRTAKENGKIYLAIQTVKDGKVVGTEILEKPMR